MYVISTDADATPPFSVDDVTHRQTEELYNGFFKMKRVSLTHPLFKGGESPVIQREFMVRGHAVAVVLFDKRANTFVLIQQFRVGPWYSGTNPWLLEVVAGMCEQGESDARVAIREIEEETGLTVDESSLVPICKYYPSPGGMDEQVMLYAANVDSSQAGRYAGVDSEDEDIRVVLADAQWAFDACKRGLIDNSATIMGIQWVQLYGEELL